MKREHVKQFLISHQHRLIKSFLFVAEHKLVPGIVARCFFNFRKLVDDCIPERIRGWRKIVNRIIDVNVPDNLVKPADVCVMLIVVKLMPHKQKNQDKTCQSDSEAKNVDEGERLLPGECAQ
jgi:hypothetical protein